MTQQDQKRRALGFVACLMLLVTCITAGCSKPLGQVSGKVFFEGRPLESGTVTFIGQNDYKAYCVIGRDKTYSFDNVPVGSVKIAFASHHRVPAGFGSVKPPPNVPHAKEEPPATALPIPEKYKNPEESGLTYTVKAGQQTFHIKLNP
jgi:hypothetical protein